MKNIHPSYLQKNEDLAMYRKMAAEGADLMHTVSVKGRTHRPDINIPYHTTIKLFNPEKDSPKQIHEVASKLNMTPPNPANVGIEPATLKGRNGNTMHVLKLHGPHAEEIKEHHKKFAHMGHPEKYEFHPHITVDEALYNHAIHSGAKTAADLGITFGNAELHHKDKVVASYKPKAAGQPGQETPADDKLNKSQPSHTFSGLKKVPTRSETNVQTITTPADKELFARKVSNANTSSARRSNLVTQKLPPKGVRSNQIKESIGTQLADNSGGISFQGGARPSQYKPKAAVLTGNALPDFESEPKPYGERGKSRRLRSEKDMIHGAIEHHEAFHNTMRNIEKHFGEENASNVINGMLSKFDPETREALEHFQSTDQKHGGLNQIDEKTGKGIYDRNNPRFNEELLATSRDILTDKGKRDWFKRLVGNDEYKHIQNIKQGHKKAFEYAKSLKPEHLTKSEVLEKGALRNLGVAAAMGSALLSGHAHAPTTDHPKYSSDRMLGAISSVESSKGKDIAHKEGGGAIHGHEHAYGKYGQMPETIRETIRMHPDLKAKHGRAMNLKGDDLHHYMKDNPGLEDTIAQRHLKRLEHHFGPRTDRIGHAWFNGISGTNKAMKEHKDIGNHFHVKKIQEAYSKEK
jgi:hypothetical protein